MRRFIAALAILLVPGSLTCAAEPGSKNPVSYDRDIRPIFQAHCQGCHQAAKQGGGLVMTSVADILKPGESGFAAVVPGKPDDSYLLELVTPEGGEAEMPKQGKPLSSSEIELIRRWIAAGAIDDSPAHVGSIYDAAHPPIYSRPPVITSIDYSPDGTLLAIAGFHEVLLCSADGQKLIARLIGMSERIESVAFSPDGKQLAVAGGQPGRLGELQIWDVAKQTLVSSIPVSNDTIYGASWSPDGKMVTVGCTDATVRGFDIATGEQVFFNSAHDDWPLKTVFSADGSLLVSVGRDMSTKLYNVPTERFIDNVTSITPGALKGGISALARHPNRNEILVGGSDGTPRTYRMERVTARVIGDDANLMRRYPTMTGRIYGAAYAPDGKTIACGSSLDGHGQVFTFASDAEFEMPEDIKKIVQKRVASQNAEEKKQLEDYVTKNTQAITKTEVPSGVYALTYHPDGKTIAAAGGDGTVRLIDAANGKIINSFVPVDVAGDVAAKVDDKIKLKPLEQDALVGEESLPSGATVTALETTPKSIELNGPYDVSQLLVTGVLDSGDRVDLTRLANIAVSGKAAGVTKLGRVYAWQDGTAKVTVQFGSRESEIPVTVTGVSQPDPISFVQDVNPILARLGCNQGTCHGAKDGKNGFKLSLRGYDPVFDVRALTDDIKSRRTNVASPVDSLMLLKATGAVPHVGGQLMKPGDPYYDILRRWIAEGTQLDAKTPRASSIVIEPHNPVVQNIGARQQLRVLARYPDGSTRDVTGETFLESGNTEVAESNRAGVVTALRRGEAPILARYEGNYAATTLTVMGDRTGFVWHEPETWNEVDGFVARKWQRMKILPSGLCDDNEFIRRVYLDLTGLPPTAEDVTAFVQDERPQRQKRDELVDRLIGSEEFIVYWTNKWADLLQVNSKYLGAAGAKQFREWIRENIASNRPYDEFCRDILTASGSNKEHPAASYYKILREPTAMMENTTHLFLAIRFNCNKCHDHPFERWTQDQYYETSAFFARVGLKRDPENPEGNIGGTAVEGAKPLWEVVYDETSGEVKHDRTGAVTAPLVPYDREIAMSGDETRREQLADWITSPQNDYFARSYANRIWAYLMGVGLIEPLDDIRAGNPPSNPELLDWLTTQFINSDFNVRHLMSLICKSRVYQLDIGTTKWNEDDTVNYSHALPKRLPAEVLYDSVYQVTGAKMDIPGVPAGTRAAALPDVQINLKDGFLDNLGRPARESACECERSSDLQLGPVMALMNGTTVSSAISQPGNALEQLVASHQDDADLINRLFLRILNRPARPEEIAATTKMMQHLKADHQQLVAQRDAYREKIQPVLAKKEANRVKAIADLEAELKAYQKELQPRLEAAEKERQQRIAAAQKVIDDHLATATKRLPAWEEKEGKSQTPWTRLTFDSLNATNKAKLEQLPDQSVYASGPNGKGSYALAGRVELPQLAALQLEAITDDRIPAKGPGRSGGGNFVLTEMTVHVWPVGKPEMKQQVKFKNAKADFSQAGYDVKTAVDGQVRGAGNGWAVVPQVGKNHYATFEFEKPLPFEGPVMVHFKLDQMYRDGKHSLGRFRLSLTDRTGPVNFGLPAAVVAVLETPADNRTEEQQKTLLDFFNLRDQKLAELQQKLAEARKPLPPDAQLVALQNRLEEAKKPLPPDPQLARLDRAVELSDAQLKKERLTAAQDLAWALINSPAFLFNR